jgi:hypothetical protein
MNGVKAGRGAMIIFNCFQYLVNYMVGSVCIKETKYQDLLPNILLGYKDFLLYDL